MENMDKGLIVLKWLLIYRPKIPQNVSANLSAQAKKLGIFEKKALWVSVVCVAAYSFLELGFKKYRRENFNISAFCIINK